MTGMTTPCPHDSTAAKALRDQAEELLAATVFESESLFGRLAAVASLQDPETGLYQHETSKRYGTEVVDSILRGFHEDVFSAWISLTVRRQVEDWIENASAVERAEWLEHLPAMSASLIPRSCQ